MKRMNSLISAVAAVAITASGALPASAADFKAKTTVLVHGSFADGSSWNKVIPLLKKAGLKVVAVQNPLDNLENDVAFTTRAIADAEGLVVLVGHSYGGAVITQAGGARRNLPWLRHVLSFNLIFSLWETTLCRLNDETV